jgi:hypothetical protein
VDFFGAFLGEVFSIIGFLVILAGVYKVFQMSTDLRETKELLRDIKRNTQQVFPAHPPAGDAAGPISPEELVRAVHAQSFDE